MIDIMNQYLIKKRRVRLRAKHADKANKAIDIDVTIVSYGNEGNKGKRKGEGTKNGKVTAEHARNVLENKVLEKMGDQEQQWGIKEHTIAMNQIENSLLNVHQRYLNTNESSNNRWLWICGLKYCNLP